MNTEIIVALIGALPGTLAAVVALRTAPRPAHDGKPSEAPNRLRGSKDAPTGIRITVVVVFAAVVTAAASLGVLNVARSIDRDGGSIARQVSVPGTQTWTNTGIDVEEGDEVVISARGEVVHSTTLNQRSGPNGDPGKRFESNVLRSADHGALLGMITSEGSPFLVGEQRTFKPSTTGRLFLGVNDVGSDNNAGAFTVDIEVHRSGG